MAYLGGVDIIMLAGTVMVSVSAGIFFAVKDKGKQSIDNYYFGGRKASPIIVAASLSVSYLSSITLIGLPTEVYLYGSVYAWNILASIISKMVGVVWYLPIYHRLQLTSVFEDSNPEYEDSKDAITRSTSRASFHHITSSAVIVSSFVSFSGIVVYMPALSLSATTPISLHAAIAITGTICTFYTTIGGMKAVLWTDMLQSAVMIAGTLSLLICTISNLGGLQELITATERGSRNNMNKFNPDPRIRNTFWTITIGLSVNQCLQTCCDQMYVQRYLSCRNVRNARIALLLSLIPEAILVLLCVANGLALYAYFEFCDPLQNGEVEQIDQSIPYLALKVFQNLPGMAGLFVAASYSGTLSTVSSGLNAMSALVLHDFLIPCFPDMKQRTRYLASMILSVLFGALVMTLAFTIPLIKYNVAGIIISFSGVSCGPVVGVFTMAAFMPWVNEKGAIIGFICSWLSIVGVGLGSMTTTEYFSPEPNRGKLPLSTDYCETTNITLTTINTTNPYLTTDINSMITVTDKFAVNTSTVIPSWTDTTGSPNSADDVSSLSISTTLLSVSPYLFGVIAFLLCLIIGNVVSLLTGRYDPSSVDWRLFAPGAKYLLCRHQLKEHPKAKASAANNVVDYTRSRIVSTVSEL